MPSAKSTQHVERKKERIRENEMHRKSSVKYIKEGEKKSCFFWGWKKNGRSFYHASNTHICNTEADGGQWRP